MTKISCRLIFWPQSMLCHGQNNCHESCEEHGRKGLPVLIASLIVQVVWLVVLRFLVHAVVCQMNEPLLKLAFISSSTSQSRIWLALHRTCTLLTGRKRRPTRRCAGHTWIRWSGEACEHTYSQALLRGNFETTDLDATYPLRFPMLVFLVMILMPLPQESAAGFMIYSTFFFSFSLSILNLFVSSGKIYVLGHIS